MVEYGCGTGLLAKAFTQMRIDQYPRPGHLERYLASQFRIAGQKDHAETAATEFPDDFKTANLFLDGENRPLLTCRLSGPNAAGRGMPSWPHPTQQVHARQSPVQIGADGARGQLGGEV